MPTKSSPKRAVAFVDGQSLFHSARSAFGYNEVNYDVSALAALLCNRQGWNLIQTRFYSGIPSRDKNPGLYHFWKSKTKRMLSQGVNVFTRQLLYDAQEKLLNDGTTVKTFVSHEKGVDVRIALDIVKLAHQKTYDVVLLFSQDQDLSELADDLKEISYQQGRTIKFACAFPTSSEATNLRGVNKTDWIQIDRATYDICLDKLDDPTKEEISNSSIQEKQFLTSLEANCGWNALQSAKYILSLGVAGKLDYNWGADNHSVVCLFRRQELSFPVLMISASGVVRVPLNNQANKILFRGNKLKREVFKKLNENPVVAIHEKDLKEDPRINIKEFTDTDSLNAFSNTINWFLDVIKKHPMPIIEKKAK